MPQIPDAVVVAAIAATAGLIGVWLGRMLVDRDNRKGRLRAIYTEVLRTAVHLTPKELGYKLSADGVDVPKPAEVDALMARLLVEADADAGPVRDAFLKLFNRAAMSIHVCLS